MAKKLPVPDPEALEGWLIGMKKNSKGEMVYAVGRYGIRNSRLHFDTREKAEEFVRSRNAMQLHHDNPSEENPAEDKGWETSKTSDVREPVGLRDFIPPLHVIDDIARWGMSCILCVVIMFLIQYHITGCKENLKAAIVMLQREIERR